MPRYMVPVTRTESVTREVPVDADSSSEARVKALEQAGDYDFGRAGDASYEADEPIAADDHAS